MWKHAAAADSTLHGSCRILIAARPITMHLRVRSSKASGATIAALCVVFFAAPIHAQHMEDCGESVRLRLSSSGASQGGLLRLEIRNVKPTSEIEADWAGHSIPFWQDASSSEVRHALLGVDLEQAAGEFPLDVKIGVDSSPELDCSAVISVREGHFAVEKLQVAKGFVDVSPNDEERAVKESERLREIYGRATPERFWQGKFWLPLDGAHQGTNFGKRRVLNGQPRSPHGGVDFPAPAGTPVHSAQRGRVVLADALFFSGNTVVIDHGLGLYTFYGHLESISVHEGDLVERGTILGRVGATGRVTGPHLHWGLIVNQARVNPLQIVALRMN